MITIGFVFQKDSHFKSVFSTSERLSEQYQYRSIFYGVDTDYAPIEPNVDVIYLGKDNLSELLSCTYLVCCLGGYLLNYIIKIASDTETKVISLFPGIVSHYQLDAFITRVNADEVWLNSVADFEFYSNICYALGLKNNGMFYGMPWLNTSLLEAHKSIATTNYRTAVFFEQTEILASVDKQVIFTKAMHSLIERNPNIQFIYKIRKHGESDFILSFRKEIAHYKNVQIADLLTDEQKRQTNIYLSISSTALIEGIVLEKSIGLLDCSLLDSYSKEFFTNSGLCLSNDNLLGNQPNSLWVKRRIAMPSKHVDLLSIRKNSNRNINKKSRHLIAILVYLFKLVIRQPKIMRFGLFKEYICIIQKALEYCQIK